MRTRKTRGKAVRRNIAGYYMHKKHMSKKRANYIAGAVAFDIKKERHHSKKHSKKRR